MSKLKWLKITNILLFISFLVQVVTSLILLFFQYTEFVAEIHKYNGIVFIVLVVAHVVLNWGWVKANFFKKK